MAPLCDEGFGPESESDIGGIGAYLVKLPYADMQRQSLRKRFLPMFTGRMKRHCPRYAIANVAVDLLLLSCLLPWSRAISLQGAHLEQF
jgi:hypothetical protein